VTTIPKAQETGRLEVVTQATTTAINVDANGRVSGVTYLKDGTEYFQPADVVLLAAYVYENVRMLLLSKSRAFPNGLSNSHGQVGRHYFSHNQGAAVTALFPRDINNWYGLPAQGVAVDNWADDNFDHSPLDFIGGGNLWVYSDRRPIGAASMTTFGRAPRWGSEWKAFIKRNADRWNTAYLQKTTLPYEDNYLDLDPTIKDPLGFPVCRITADYKDNERKVAAFIQDKMVEWFMAAGAVATGKGLDWDDGSHHARLRRDTDGRQSRNQRRQSVGLRHEVPNLGILGASVMGTSGARNPTLTAQALAWRTADHLAKNWKTIADVISTPQCRQEGIP
jgi:gluconate 2-dehydrogenase alpha chain